MAQDEGAASVGVVETTNEPTPYEHPDFSAFKNLGFARFTLSMKSHQPIRIFTLGVGTPNYPRSSYLEKIQFQQLRFLSHSFSHSFHR